MYSRVWSTRKITARALRPGSRPGAAAPVADEQLPHGARREFAPFDSDSGLRLPHHVRRQSRRSPACAGTRVGGEVPQDDFHRSPRRPVAVRAHECPARAHVLQISGNRRRGARAQLHGHTHCEALTPSMLHDRISPTGGVIALCSHRVRREEPNIAAALTRRLCPCCATPSCGPTTSSAATAATRPRTVPPGARRSGPT